MSTVKPGACLVIGAGADTGGAIAHAFAREGYQACLARRPRNADDLEKLAESIRAEGNIAHATPVDARDEDAMIALVERIETEIAPIEVAVFNIGANVNFPITETTGRVYRKVWEMAAFSGFLMGRENLPDVDAKRDEEAILSPDAIAANYVMLHNQPRSAWTHELDLRPWKENW